MAQAPAQNYITVFEDSRRWRNVARRDGDIIISTPPKSGTTWMQGIIRSLLWPAGDAPGSRAELSPWVDMRLTPIETLVDQLRAQDHRRFLKTHSPGDCTPFERRCQYVVVYRDGRDALMSWANHRATMRPAVVELANAAALDAAPRGEPIKPLNPRWDGDYDELLDEWLRICSPMRHLAAWWPRRHEPNVLFVHYNDLSADLEAEMRRLAEFVAADVTETQWPSVVERCRLDRMRQEAQRDGDMPIFDGGASAFFFMGTNGRWRNTLTELQLERYRQAVVELLPDDAASWLEHGSGALGARPDAIGSPDTRTVDTGAWHPLLSRLAKQPSNSIDAITDRRVEEAREAGLFDDLSLHGKPIPDLDRPRPPGWWANQFVAKERNKVTAMQLEDDIRAAMPALWRLATAAEVVDRIAVLNQLIDEYNRVTTLSPMDRLETGNTLATWRRLQDRDG